MKLTLLGMLMLVFAVSCRKPPKLTIPDALNPDNKPSPTSGPAPTTTGTCLTAVTCSTSLPTFPAPTGFKDTYKKGISTAGSPSHRARDVLVTEGKPIWILAKFAYSILDADLKEEPIDVYLSEGCTGDWKKITTVKTSKDDQNTAVEGVADSGGRIYLDLGSLGIKLPVGRHRVILQVPADGSYTEMSITVIPTNQQVVVTDIDGTLTSSELAAATEIIGQQPSSHESAAAMMQAFAKRDYQIFYLTARPEWLMQKTREWLKDKGFPPGTIHTTNSKAGATGDAASKFKMDELSLLKLNTGLVPAFAFGNKPSDAKAFGEQGINPKQSYYYALDGDALGGVIHKDYGALINMAEQAAPGCR